MIEFTKIIDEYHTLIRTEIAKDTDLQTKVIKVEKLVYIMHTLIADRYGSDYLNKANQYKKAVITNNWNEENISATINDNTRKKRFDLVIEWFCLILEQDERVRLSNNLNKVQR